ncbi:unnamed protein product [Acanthoscelides obtectus]|uniref:poly(ADP-ribose) glycohydrolase n=1 Tax=Acanthoscelides obtectus TaxID=200917 RepID=A0A9P0JMP9_ACAOB|nr:unnamed protein product [Acanthoscelides obtectus]CAK1639654.1 Probable poly(ADP-ribose) glycohydrolase 2 [Acanthoscelides obtectus]
MALVMLPSDLPWWDSVKKQLKKIANTKNTTELTEGMQKIYEMCNISLDPDEEEVDPQQFVGLQNFLDNDLNMEERDTFLKRTLPAIVKRALKIKDLKPKGGLRFSLQQQPDTTELQYSFISSLIANAFFSTFALRTEKTHPTLQNFNFANFFKTLNSHVQKSKLKSILYYFEWLENNENVQGSLRIHRQVMHSKEWLTIEDWLECSLPLCPLRIKHDTKLERCQEESLRICFCSAKIGGNVLKSGCTQECINLVTMPELLTVLLNVETLEDNEVLTIEKVRHISRILDPKHRATLEKMETSKEVTVCCIDADDYTKLPVGQYEEDNILRELNKCLLGFQQKQTKTEVDSQTVSSTYNLRRRLSPIGESMSSTSSEQKKFPVITQTSASTNQSDSDSPISENNNTVSTNKLRVMQLEMENALPLKKSQIEAFVHNRRGRFIVLGSSGECLPVNRFPLDDQKSDKSNYSSCESSSESEFHSAEDSSQETQGSEEERNYHKRYSIELETDETRNNFAQRLKEALKKEMSSSTEASTSIDESYAVGITVAGSELQDRNIRLKRGDSTGFALKEDSLDEDFIANSLDQGRQWVDKFKDKQSALTKKDSNKSSDYSFSTDYSSELEEAYDQFTKWLENPLLETEKGTKRELDARELAVLKFAGSLLKRTLSESFAGVPVPMAEGCVTNTGCTEDFSTRKNKLVLNAKSLSLELARQKHRLASQLLSQIAQCPKDGPKPVSTGNWGCGSSRKGDVQLKAMVQWLAASVAGIPYLSYCTYGHQQLVKLDTVGIEEPFIQMVIMQDKNKHGCLWAKFSRSYWLIV